jgi:lipopolysaccharide/colanic/teichoic acid biosynthesis glycosyltransferase
MDLDDKLFKGDITYEEYKRLKKNNSNKFNITKITKNGREADYEATKNKINNYSKPFKVTFGIFFAISVLIILFIFYFIMFFFFF